MRGKRTGSPLITEVHCSHHDIYGTRTVGFAGRPFPPHDTRQPSERRWPAVHVAIIIDGYRKVDYGDGS